MLHFLLAISCVVSIELIVYMRFLPRCKAAIDIAYKSSRVVFSHRIHDARKEQMMRIYAYLLMKHSFFLLMAVVMVGIIFGFLSLISHQAFQIIFTLFGFIELVIFTWFYLKVRQLFCNE